MLPIATFSNDDLIAELSYRSWRFFHDELPRDGARIWRYSVAYKRITLVEGWEFLGPVIKGGTRPIDQDMWCPVVKPHPPTYGLLNPPT